MLKISICYNKNMKVYIQKGNYRFYPIKNSICLDKSLGITPYLKVDNIIKDKSMVYLLEEDYIRYTKKIINSSISTEAAKIHSISMALETSFILLEKMGVTPDIINLQKEISKHFLKLKFNDEFKKEFKQMVCSQKVKNILLKCILTKAISQKIPWWSGLMSERLFVATFFCDLGSIGCPEGTFHARRSYELLQKKGLTPDILQAILHHHENNDGTGPLGMTRFQIQPMAKIIRVVDKTIDIVSAKSNLKEEMSVLISKKLETEYVRYCLELFNLKI